MWKKPASGCHIPRAELESDQSCWFWLDKGTGPCFSQPSCYCWNKGKMDSSRAIMKEYGYLVRHPYDVWLDG